MRLAMASHEERPLSKGMKLVAEYRAARINQGPIRRSDLRRSHIALREDRDHAGRRHEPSDTLTQAYIEPAKPSPVAKAVDDRPSVFAGLVSAAACESVACVQDSLEMPDIGSRACEPAPETLQKDANVIAEVSANAIYDPPLAEIGFGPGMLIRLSQIGVRSTRDLAQVDVAALRSALGEICRLVDVDGWVNSARASILQHSS
jgi:hypothetical protein